MPQAPLQASGWTRCSTATRLLDWALSLTSPTAACGASSSESAPPNTSAGRLPPCCTALPTFQWRTSVRVAGSCRASILTGCVVSCRYDNLYGDYYISPQFLEAITVSGQPC